MGDLNFAAHGFNLHLVLKQCLLNQQRVGVGAVTLVDGNDQRHVGRLGVGDGFLGLGHDAVVGSDHQNHHVGDVGATGTHLGKGGVARGVEEGDQLATRRLHLVGADVLGDAPGLPGDHVGLAVEIEDRGLAVIDVTHDRHHRRAWRHSTVVVVRRVEAFENVRIGNPADGVAQFSHHQFGGVGVDRLVHRSHHAHFHQLADDVTRALGHTVGKLADSNGFRHDDFTHDLLLGRQRFLRALLLALALTADGRQRTHPILIPLQRIGDGQAGTAAAATVILGAQGGFLALIV